MAPYKKSTKPEFYKLKSHEGRKDLTITKFDEDLDATSLYHMTWMETKDGGYYDCSCPAAKFDCRHKTIMKDIQLLNGVDSPKFYCHQAPNNPSIVGKLLDPTEIS